MIPSLVLASTLLMATPVEATGIPLPPAGDAMALPAGDSAAWRAAMLGWSGTGVPLEYPLPTTLMERPVASGWLSSHFGGRADPIRRGWRIHRGVDIAAPFGTSVVAASDGIIGFAGTAGGYGNLVQIDHPTGFQTRYGHLSRILVRNGEAVSRGEVIGLVGSTGRSTGSHLHFEIRVAGLAVDPQRPLPPPSDRLPRTAAPAAPVTARWQGITSDDVRLPAAYR